MPNGVHALQFRRRGDDSAPLPGIILPATAEQFDALRYGRTYDVDGDAFSELKRLDQRSAVFFLVDNGGGGGERSLRGIFCLETRPELDRDELDGGYFAKMNIRPSEMLPEMPGARFRETLPNVFINETECYSDLDLMQAQQLAYAMKGLEPQSAPTAPRWGSSGSGGSYYDGFYSRRTMMPRWEEADRGRYDMEGARQGAYYSMPSEMHHRPPPPSVDRWRNEPRTGHVSPVPQRPPESEQRPVPSVTCVDVGIQTDEDERMTEMQQRQMELTAEIDRLRDEARGKDVKMTAMQAEIGSIRMVLFNRFHYEAFGAEDDESSDHNPAHVSSDQRETQAAAPNDVPRPDSAHLSPRSTYEARFSPPPLRSGQCYSPLPNQTAASRTESPRPTNETAALEAALAIEAPVAPQVESAAVSAEVTAHVPLPFQPPPVPVASDSPGPPPPGIPSNTPSQGSRLPQYGQQLAPPPFPMMHPHMAPQPIWGAPQSPYYAAIPSPITAPPGMHAPRPVIMQPNAAEPPPRPLPAVQTTQAHVAIIGGYSNQQKRNTIDVFYPETSLWTKITDFPEGMSFMWGGSAVVGQMLFLFGGMDNAMPLSSVRKYSFQSRSWQQLQPMPNPRKGVAAAQLGNKVYFISEQSVISDAVHIYDIATDQWTAGACLRQMRKHHTVAAMTERNLIFTFGGWGSPSSLLDTIEQYDPRQGNWVQVGRMERARLLMSGVATDTEVFGIGGTFRETKYPTTYVDVFDVRRQEWRAGEDLNYARNEAASIFLGQDLYVIGGFDGNTHPCTMERRRGSSNFWQTHITDGRVDARCFHNVVKLNFQIS